LVKATQLLLDVNFLARSRGIVTANMSAVRASHLEESAMRRKIRIVLMLLVVVVAAWFLWPKKKPLGNARFFADQTYYFEAIRVLTDTSPAGGDTGEAFEAINHIKTADADSWYAAWDAEGDRVSALAGTIHDRSSRGDALLRAHVYYRTAEFFLDPKDPRRPESWKKNVRAFYSGLDALGVHYERIKVPYGPNHHLNALYFPGPAGAETKPLLIVVNGYDGTMEELYAQAVVPAYRRGYSVLTYEGPGQGSVLREQGLTLTPAWEKPNGAVLDAFLAGHPKPAHMVIMGISMGGYFAPRAAAFEPRIDGVIAFDEFFDGYAVAARHVPGFAFTLHRHGLDRVLNFLAERNETPGAKWAQQNGMWTLGQTDRMAVLDAFRPYTLAPVAAQIRGDVLILAGAEDHFVPIEQVDTFKRSLTHAHSVTTVVYDRASGGAEHCQVGAPSLWQATVFDWLAAKFGPGDEARP
jgi:alpha-beta hydrolase superfamily lysophospholipase